MILDEKNTNEVNNNSKLNLLKENNKELENTNFMSVEEIQIIKELNSNLKNKNKEFENKIKDLQKENNKTKNELKSLKLETFNLKNNLWKKLPMFAFGISLVACYFFGSQIPNMV